MCTRVSLGELSNVICPLQDYQSCHEQSEEVIMKDNLFNIQHEVQPLVVVYDCQVALGGTDLSSYMPLSVDRVHVAHTEHFFRDLGLNTNLRRQGMYVVQAQKHKQALCDMRVSLLSNQAYNKELTMWGYICSRAWKLLSYYGCLFN